MSKHVPGRGRMPSRKLRRLAMISAIVAVFALGATAAVSLRANQAKSQAKTSATSATSTQPASSGQTTGTRANLRFGAAQELPLNPQTGQIRPLTQEEAQRLAAGIKELVNQSSDGLQSVQHADGSVSVDLQGRFQSVAVAKRDENGTLTQSCVDNPQSAAAFFQIDPKLVGVQPAPKTNSAAPTKGDDR